MEKTNLGKVIPLNVGWNDLGNWKSVWEDSKKDIENKFSEQPLLIKKFENLDQELAIANENLLSLISARESFQLEMAQNNIPWRIISAPTMGGIPIKPNIKLNQVYYFSYCEYGLTIL